MDAQITWFLGQCPKPYAFNPDRVTFSFRHGWVEVMRPDTPEEIIEQHVDEWFETCDEDRLHRLREKIDELLGQAESTEIEV